MAAVEVTHEHAVAVLRINRPEARNAVNGDVAAGMEAALDAAEQDAHTRAVIVTGTGTAFCAGADLKLIAAGRGAELATERGGFAGFVTRDFPKPIIAAVNGSALAGGFEIVLHCDLVVAAQNTTFGLPEVKRGLFAAAGALIRLPKRVPLALATEIAITGEPISAERALQLGLVNRVVEAGHVVDEALDIARIVAANGPRAVRNTLRMIREAGDLTEEAAWPRNYELAMEVFLSPDAVEGSTAFAEKRPPRWSED